MCKVYEACVLVHIEPMLTSHISQFGFDKKSGCDKALFAFTFAVIISCIENLYKYYFCVLDAAKAFNYIQSLFNFQG